MYTVSRPLIESETTLLQYKLLIFASARVSKIVQTEAEVCTTAE